MSAPFGAAAVLAIPVLLMVAVAAWAMPGRLAVRGDRGPERLAPPGAAAGSKPARWRGVIRRWRRRVRSWWGRDPTVDLGAVLTEVAARLEAGEPPPQAWQRALPGAVGASGVPGVHPVMLRPVVDDDGVPAALTELLPSRTGSGRAGQQRIALAHQVAGAQVACRMAHTVGAPLAQVLQSSAAGVAEAGRAQAARRAALAAPRATARLLGWLPLAALVLGSAWGAAPMQVLLDGGWGTVCLVAGGVLMIAGHVWASRLVGAAERAGQ